MSSDSSSLTLMTRNKMHSSGGSKDRCSLHRWVLLKNSLSILPTSSPTNPSLNVFTETNQAYSVDSYEHNDEPVETGSENGDSFLFPDAGKLVSTSQPGGSEAQWLDTLLKELGDDEYEDELGEPDVISSASHVEDDDDDVPLSPLSSPVASSNDLHNQISYYSSDLAAVSFHIPYPQYQPPLLRSYQEVPSSISSLPAPYDDPLPYHDLDYVTDCPVPDAILEDTSDDESDTPSTPSFGRSSASLALSDSPSTSPIEHGVSRHSKNHLYPDKDALFLPFESDPLPFSNERHNSYNTYQGY
ncbi:hypothetical protein AX15_004905 [Amanita polypyramis BW_CC]|nr:hypothetical protein AX15_004905 [Amanita polypyramis BW_CC]